MLKKFFKDEEGSEAVQMAILLPIILLLVMFITDRFIQYEGLTTTTVASNEALRAAVVQTSKEDAKNVIKDTLENRFSEGGIGWCSGRFSLAGDCCTGGAPDRNYCGFVRRTVFPVPDPQGKEEEHMNHSFLTVRGLDYSIDGTEILQDVSLEVPEGTFVGLIGPNGCGKSTLLKNIYKTYRPQKDTVYIDGKDVVSLSAKEMARQAAVVAQENQTEFDLEVLDMVMYGRYAHRRFLEKETEEDLAICRRFLEEVGLKGYENRSFFSLSGGEKQRVLMARALAQESRLILLDEPTNHLDIRFQYLLMEILKKQDATIFSSVHDLNIAAMYCDRVLLMDRGRIIKAGTPEEILTEENILQIFGIHAQITKNPITQKIQVYYIPKG